jgi:hypothetical protein
VSRSFPLLDLHRNPRLPYGSSRLNDLRDVRQRLSVDGVGRPLGDFDFGYCLLHGWVTFLSDVAAFILIELPSVLP